MKAWAQRRWAIVYAPHGYIDHSTITFSRRNVIAKVVAEYRSYPWFVDAHPNLTDAQFWRVIKRTRHMAVRRISMRVVS